MRQFVVPAVVERVHDGDTCVLDLDLGPHSRPRGKTLDLGWHVRCDPDGHIRMACAVRINGLACPELWTPEGKASRDYAQKLLPVGARVRLVSKMLLGSFEKYGRVLGDIEFNPDPARPSLFGSFAVAMIEANHGKAWDGTGKQPT